MKILVVNTKFFGDLILSTPGISAIREKNPDAEIVLLTRKGYEAVLKNNPGINRIIPFDFGIKKKTYVKRIINEINFIRKIRSENFDVVISLHPGDRIAFLAWFSGAKTRIAPRKQSFNFLFNVLVDVEEDSISYLQYYNKLISAFIERTIEGKTEFFVPRSDKLWADKFLSENSVNENDLLIGIHPGASEPTKIWPYKNFIELINKTFSLGKIKILLIAGPDDIEIVKSISQGVNSKHLSVYHSNDVNLTAALVQKCNLFISNDTGTRHLAVALKIPVIALMPEDNQKCWNFYEETDNHFVLTGKRIFPERSRPYLGEISVDDVFNKTKSILNL